MNRRPGTVSILFQAVTTEQPGANPTPGMQNRYPLALWISNDDMRSFKDRRVVTDFPGRYCYPDGFYEDGHILFTIEINRHEILFFDCEV